MCNRRLRVWAHGTRDLATAEEKKRAAEERSPIDKKLAELREKKNKLLKIGSERVEPQRDELIKRMFHRDKVSKYGTEEVFDPVRAKFFRFTAHRSTVGSGKSAVCLDEFEVFTPEPNPENVALASRGTKVSVRSFRPLQR